MGVGKAQGSVLWKVTWRHQHHWENQECGQSQISRSSEDNILLKRADQANPTVGYPTEAFSGSGALWVPKAASHVDAAIVWTIVAWQAQPYLSCQHHGLLNPKVMWSPCPCCHYGHVVDPALQVTRVSWTPKPLPVVWILLSCNP